MISSSDPLNRNIVLKATTWQYKIMSSHPEMEPYLNELKSVIESPYYIVKDMIETEPGKMSVHPTREEYFDLFPSKTTSGIIILRAIIDHTTKPSEVVTAFQSSKVKGITTEGGIIYVRSN